MGAVIDTTALQYNLRTLGQEKLVEQFTKANPFFELARKKKKEFGGRNNWELDLYAAPTPAVYARAEGDTLPAAVAPTVTGCNVGKATLYVPIKITGHMLRAQKLTEARITEIVNFTMNDAKWGMNRAVDRMLCGDGTGVLATLDTGSTNTVLPITDSIFPIVLKDLGKAQGMIDVLNATTGAVSAQGLTVLNYSVANKTITVDSSVTWTTGDVIVIHGNAKGVSSVYTNLELDGIRKLVGTGTYLGINPASAGSLWWKSIVTDANSQAVDAIKFQKLVDDVIDEAPEPPTIIFGGRAAIRAYASQYINDIRFKPETLPSGIKVMTFTPFDGPPMRIFSSRHAYPSDLMFLNENHLWFFYTEIAQWRNYGGAGILRDMETEDAVKGELILEGQFATDCRAAHGMFTNCPTA